MHIKSLVQPETMPMRLERSRMKKRKENHKWTEEDDIVTLYLYKFGHKDLPHSVEYIGRKLGMGAGSLKMRIANFKAIDGKGGLEHYGKTSLKIFERYKQTSKDELKSLVLKIVKRS